ncbi:MAG TPA: acyl-CoA dehydrogenase family protein [Vicinamibacterales bacterium]|jgi:alkylation response protein AidB-like acyl-CoA dehydrogenase|nr:acyl-CoA dehydrogenase family protein [Vicinamibacterales bacterium]
MAVTTTARKGASWLLEESDQTSMFTPEKLSEEHRLMAQTVEEFVDNEVMPNLDQLETKDWKLARSLVKRAGELGLLGISVPEQYGGLDLDKASALVVSERMARSASMGAAYGAQANLTIIPIVLFGTDAQKAKYLPGLVSGDMVGAYCLSESGSGSDALAARTRATKQADGSWILNGEKMWITNGGFADVFIVFAQADGDQFTAFIVERAFGVKSGNEEHKMGLHGSSTTPILLQDVTVPAENLLGEVGKGAKVALNTLNFGRFKLGAMCSGGCRSVIGEAAKYAKQRKQFGHAISDFGAIKYKLGEMTARTYALESLMYRTAGLIDATVAEAGEHGGSAIAAALEEFAVEASIAKVMGSEVLDYVLDENVQIHGGNGFVKDYPAERYYRDARVNRIFEGTNEINRMLIPGMLIRRALKGEIGVIPAAKKLQDELLSPTGASALGEEGLDADLKTVGAFKKVALMVLGTAMQTYGQKLTDEQEILCAAADILIDTYAAESAVLRAREAAGRPDGRLHEAAARTFVNDAAQRVQATATNALAGMADGDTLRTLMAALRRVLKVTPVNTVALRRTLADATVARERYIVS